VAGVGDNVQATLGPALAPIRARAISPYELLPAPTVIAASAASALRCPTAAGDSGRYYFRLDFRDRSLSTSGAQPSPAVQEWLIDTLTAHGRSVYQPDWTYAIVLGGPRGEPAAAVAYAVKYAQHRAPVSPHGFATCPAVLGPDYFRGVLDRRALLPASLTGGASNDSIVAVDVSDRAGHAIF